MSKLNLNSGKNKGTQLKTYKETRQLNSICKEISTFNNLCACSYEILSIFIKILKGKKTPILNQ